jgi:hypothetical protein
MCCVWRALGLTEHTLCAATWRSDRQWNGDAAVEPGSAILTAHILLFTRPTTEIWHKKRRITVRQHRWNIHCSHKQGNQINVHLWNITLTFPVTHNWVHVNVLRQIQIKSTGFSV